MSQIFKILFQTGKINVFVLRGFLFSTYAQLKAPLPVKSETHFSREAIEN